MQHLKDPAAGVSLQLLPHLHLISKYRYPLISNPSLETIVGYLIEAPKIVRDLQPVQWQMLDAPQDGTLLLVWQPYEYLGTNFASDGFVWADAEQSFKQEIRGYNVEMLLHRSGFRPPGEAVASHSRKRYRLLPTNPATGLPTGDPSLWIIHYTKATSRDHIPAASIPLGPQVQAILHQRRIIQGRGQLPRKDFMLHDRSNWPMISAPQELVGRVPQGPPSRRPPSINMPIPPGEVTTEEEEDISRGDLLDFTSQREISRMRYEQHHEWMEEIVDSPYATKQIVPTDLGLGRKGELESLTRGFFEPPNLGVQEMAGNAGQARVGKMDPGKAEDFAKMAAQKVAGMQAELETMKKRHARRMENLKRTTILNSAEKRLRSAGSGSSQQIAPDTSEESATKTSQESADDIVEEVETAWGKKVQRVMNVTCVEKGGLEDRAATRAAGGPSSNGNTSRGATSPTMSAQQGSVNGQTTTPPTQSGAQEAIQSTSAMDQTPPLGQNAPISTDLAGDQAQIQEAEERDPMQDAVMENGHTALSPLDQMDDDVEMTGLDDRNSEQADFTEGNEWVMVNEDNGKNNASDDESGPLDPEGLEFDEPDQTGTPEMAQSSRSVTQGLTPAVSRGLDAELNTGDFDDQNEFDSGDMDTAGDALADYGVENDDELDLGAMDDSAFNDAFGQPDDSHGMDNGDMT